MVAHQKKMLLYQTKLSSNPHSQPFSCNKCKCSLGKSPNKTKIGVKLCLTESKQRVNPITNLGGSVEMN